jgi:hypothetical protein
MRSLESRRLAVHPVHTHTAPRASREKNEQTKRHQAVRTLNAPACTQPWFSPIIVSLERGGKMGCRRLSMLVLGAASAWAFAASSSWRGLALCKCRSSTAPQLGQGGLKGRDIIKENAPAGRSEYGGLRICAQVQDDAPCSRGSVRRMAKETAASPSSTAPSPGRAQMPPPLPPPQPLKEVNVCMGVCALTRTHARMYGEIESIRAC